MSAPPGPSLRRELRFWEAIALSIGIMAPTAAMALNGTVPAGLVGRAVPLVMLLATIGVLFVMYGFVRLSRYFSHAGSVYAFTGLTLGPQAGFFAGWALLGTYLAFTVGSSAEVGLFGGQFLNGVFSWQPNWIWLALIALVFISLIAYGDVKVATRTLLALEVVSVTLITILIVVIFVKVIGGGAPGDQTFTLHVFQIGPHSYSTLGFATVFLFLSFAGFEGAAALGEETGNPSQTIPLAIRRAVLFAGAFYMICILAQTLGFGATGQGAAAYASSSSPLGDLGRSYIGSGFGDAINLGAAISGFASALGTAAGGSRILYALCRDGFLSPRLGQVSRRTGSPANALAVVITVAAASLILMRINGTSAVNAFFYPGTIGVLSLIVAYVLTNFGAMAYLPLGGRAPYWEAVFPVVAICFLGYVLVKQVYPVPAYPYNVFPYLVGGWLAVGLLVVLLVPGLARSIGERLAAEAVPPEELTPAEAVAGD